MILLDTTVLIYAVGADHRLREPCRRTLELVRNGTVPATTTVEVVQEFAHVRARNTGRLDAASLARWYAEGLGPLTRPDDDDLLEGLALFEEVDSLGAFDAVLGATARRRGWPVASADRAFGRIESLTHLDPASPTFVEEVLGVG